ncbi:hypothetical protein CEXT_327891 [Caerostris extrusa]|uniref:Uncharacterized protein n=1 Tax=Caerostris extrusa TaxID=172846 RepID=A0AAV4VC99_CAEEX|nr:hypothetical protein CEXT_327891 [Caerostris extrusa]
MDRDNRAYGCHCWDYSSLAKLITFHSQPFEVEVPNLTHANTDTMDYIQSIPGVYGVDIKEFLVRFRVAHTITQ